MGEFSLKKKLLIDRQPLNKGKTKITIRHFLGRTGLMVQIVQFWWSPTSIVYFMLVIIITAFSVICRNNFINDYFVKS
jgi:hypothetical protein